MGILGLDNKKQSNNIVVWILLLFVVFGFGKYRNLLGSAANLTCSSGRQKRCREKSCSCCSVNNDNFLSNGNLFGLGSINNLFQGNWLFVLIVIGILFMCKDNDDEDNCGARESFSSDCMNEDDENSIIDINNSDDTYEDDTDDDYCNSQNENDDEYCDEMEDYCDEDDCSNDRDEDYDENGFEDNNED